MAKSMRSFFFLGCVSVSSSDVLFDFFMFQDHLPKKPSSLDDSDLEARLNSWNLGVKQSKLLIY